MPASPVQRLLISAQRGAVDMTGLPQGQALDVRADPALLLELTTKSFENILVHAISSDASWLAYSCASGSRLFRLRIQVAFQRCTTVMFNGLGRCGHGGARPGTQRVASLRAQLGLYA